MPECDAGHVYHLFVVRSAQRSALQSALTAQGATVLGMTFPDAAKVMPVARPARRRMHAFNQAIRSIGERHGMLIADLDRNGVVDAAHGREAPLELADLRSKNELAMVEHAPHGGEQLVAQRRVLGG